MSKCESLTFQIYHLQFELFTTVISPFVHVSIVPLKTLAFVWFASLSYSCMPNVKVIIEGNNKKKLRNDNQTKNEKKCSCPRNTTCLAKRMSY